mmetsp:Transcript_3156/g.19471  ORF Transcript_3156/g.19471 Transcript_3156/m.19471 type:complete len:254 (-) Transcript_3156:1969-2730(-)
MSKRRTSSCIEGTASVDVATSIPDAIRRRLHHTTTCEFADCSESHRRHGAARAAEVAHDRRMRVFLLRVRMLGARAAAKLRREDGVGVAVGRPAGRDGTCARSTCCAAERTEGEEESDGRGCGFRLRRGRMRSCGGCAGHDGGDGRATPLPRCVADVHGQPHVLRLERNDVWTDRGRERSDGNRHQTGVRVWNRVGRGAHVEVRGETRERAGLSRGAKTQAVSMEASVPRKRRRCDDWKLGGYRSACMDRVHG